MTKSTFSFTRADLARDLDAEIREMYNEGWTVSTIAYLMGITEEEVWEVLGS